MLRLLALITAGGLAVCHFTHGASAKCIRRDKRLRNNLSEHQIDHMVEDSFPASDPPSTY